jgi:hypothetical protein
MTALGIAHGVTSKNYQRVRINCDPVGIGC